MTDTPLEPLTATAKLLSRFSLFADVSHDTLAQLAASMHMRSWPAGSVLFQRGDEGDYLLAVVEGRLRLMLCGAQGRDLMIKQIEAGDVVGELAVIDGQPRSADAVVIEPTRALVLHRDRFQSIASQRPDLGLAMARALCEMLRSTNFQMESIALYDLQMRVIRFFLFSLHQIHGDTLPEEGVLRLYLSQSDLSSVLGASRPKINQALQALIVAGALRREGDTIICNVAKLRTLAEISDARDLG
ncbi:MAG: Crp/Fnr family transcriptional regulator [Paracoccaceae bacterium]